MELTLVVTKSKDKWIMFYTKRNMSLNAYSPKPNNSGEFSQDFKKWQCSIWDYLSLHQSLFGYEFSYDKKWTQPRGSPMRRKKTSRYKKGLAK